MAAGQTPSSKPPRGWGHVFRQCALVLASTLLALLAVEAGLRLWSPSSLRLFPRFHEAVHYGSYVLRRTRPDTQFTHSSVDGRWPFAINHQGFRDDHDYRLLAAPGVRRVLVLGDSQAMGYENRREDGLAARLAQDLLRRGIRTEVLNTGVAGFGNAEEAIFLEQSGMRYRPDAVVLMFYRNDYSDNVRSGLFALNDRRLVGTGRTYAPGTSILAGINRWAPLRWLSQHSYVYSLVFNAVWNAVKNASIRASVDPHEQAVSLEVTVPEAQKRLAEALIGRMAASLQARGIPFIIVDVPERPLDGKVTGFRASLEPEMLRSLRLSGLTIVSSEDVLAPYRGKRVFRRPHGENHISPFVHAMLSRAVADQLAAPLTRREPLAAQKTALQP